MKPETDFEKAKRIIDRETARNRKLVHSMHATGIERKDWTSRQVKSLRLAMRQQQLEVLEELQTLLNG